MAKISFVEKQRLQNELKKELRDFINGKTASVTKQKICRDKFELQQFVEDVGDRITGDYSVILTEQEDKGVVVMDSPRIDFEGPVRRRVILF